MSETENSKKFKIIKNEKEALRKRIWRANKKLGLSDEDKTKQRDKNRKRQQNYRKNMSDSKKRKIYDQQYMYKKNVWLKKPENKEKHSEYIRNSRMARHNAFEAETPSKRVLTR